MQINTRYFGDIEFNESDIINFPGGIFGFERFNKYVLIKFDDISHSMFCLQGIEDNSPVFIVFNPFEIVDNYSPEITDADKQDIECSNEDDLEYYVIANITQPMENTVVNLRSPVVINVANKLAKQVIMDKYELRHPMFKKTEE